MAEWQPIATAPKDRQIILYCKRFGIQAPGKWNPDKYAKNPRSYWVSSAESIWGVRMMRLNQPTHWMLSPKDPEGA